MSINIPPIQTSIIRPIKIWVHFWDIGKFTPKSIPPIKWNGLTQFIGKFTLKIYYSPINGNGPQKLKLFVSQFFKRLELDLKLLSLI